MQKRWKTRQGKSGNLTGEGKTGVARRELAKTAQQRRHWECANRGRHKEMKLAALGTRGREGARAGCHGDRPRGREETGTKPWREKGKGQADVRRRCPAGRPRRTRRVRRDAPQRKPRAPRLAHGGTRCCATRRPAAPHPAQALGHEPQQEADRQAGRGVRAVLNDERVAQHLRAVGFPSSLFCLHLTHRKQRRLDRSTPFEFRPIRLKSAYDWQSWQLIARRAGRAVSEKAVFRAVGYLRRERGSDMSDTAFYPIPCASGRGLARAGGGLCAAEVPGAGCQRSGRGRFGSVRVGLVRFGSVRLGSARPGRCEVVLAAVPGAAR